MNISNAYARKKTLVIVVAVSVGLHLIAILVFGTLKIVESIVREEKTFEAPEIIEVPQEQPEYTVNLEQRNQSSAPPRPNPIVVDVPDITIPALNINLSIANSSSYGRGTGGFGTGMADMREMVMGNLEFFGKEFKTAGHVMFVIDISGSMVMKARGADGYQKVVAELMKTLKGMKGIDFNIIAFAKGAEKFQSSYVTANSKGIRQAERWLLERDPRPALGGGGHKKTGWDVFRHGSHSGTRADLSLEMAFGDKPGMVFFLSDGEPTGSTSSEVLKMLKKWLARHAVPITTISYKSTDGRSFLEEVAKMSGGEAVIVD